MLHGWEKTESLLFTVTEWRDKKLHSRLIPRHFFETKCFRDRYQDFFWDQIFSRPILRLFLRPYYLRPRLRLFFETKFFETETETFFKTRFFETDTETFLDMTSDSGFGWEFSPTWISLSWKMEVLCTFRPLPKK